MARHLSIVTKLLNMGVTEKSRNLSVKQVRQQPWRDTTYTHKRTIPISAHKKSGWGSLGNGRIPIMTCLLCLRGVLAALLAFTQNETVRF
jgi:hypothetical protein